MEERQRSAIDALFDENDSENIVLFNEEEKPVEFEQIAVIPLKDKTYVILKPVEKMEEIKDDEALVFELVEDDENGDTLRMLGEAEEDIKIIDDVFADYNKLMDEEDKKHK